MDKQLRKLLSERCKDFGLTDKALDELAEIGSAVFTDQTTDEEVSAAADSLVPIAKVMQGEITRKAQARTQSARTQSVQQSKSEGEEGKNGDGEKEDEVPVWFKKRMAAYDESLKKLQDENEALKAEKTKTARLTEITAKAKELGIPEYLMKRVAFADGADIDKELAEYKQDLVTNNLMPKAGAEMSNSEEAMKADAEAWAQSLPNK